MTYIGGSVTALFVNKTTGKVGIRTTAPTYELGVWGQGAATGGFITGGPDVAENYPTYDLSIEPGDLIIPDPQNPNFIIKSNQPYQSSLMGIISTKPGFIMTGNEDFFSSGKISKENERLVALTGRVPVKVNLQNGPIGIGDYLTSSDVPGVAMKATKAGRVIGMALEEYNPNSTNTDPNATNIGKIMVFVNPHWQGFLSGDGSLAVNDSTSTDSISVEEFVKILKNITSIVTDAITGIPRLIVNAVLEVKNDIVSHGAFKSVIKVARIVVEGRTITFDNAASLAENSQLEVAGEDADSFSFVTYSIVSPRKEIMVSGSGELKAVSTSTPEVEAKIAFHPSFSAIISTSTPIRVVVTPTTYINGNLYTAEKSIYGFTIKEINSQDAGAEFDWIVTARLTDPELAQTVLENMNNLATQENIGSATSTDSVYQNGANRPCSTEVGVCQIGVQIYYDGVWGECMGAVFPTAEICDGVDNDCDATIDEGEVCGGQSSAETSELAPEPEPEPTATSTEPIAESEPEPEPVIATSTEPLVETSTTTAITATSTEQ
ncbi:MAG: hypothetical protein UU41_C0055G0002 [Candidatus Roizmanbacteria bacterium GW2011_GWA1_41_13]|uniref:Uncharacterized protein n=1 Tax=Candidatus Roizmanbacteria bacterium GW2011_GWA1_41_13 TaxID=1618474 RepID=A0A0G0XSG8_9BACT|nr:MAG: hypothetical protein UU41_C0055G0002 [Candidatus Roizmanbacteria bacterium GW2011_GWA1_41_13]